MVIELTFEPKPRGAPAKKPRRTARELTTSRSPPENLKVRTNRVRTAKKQACEKWTLTILQLIFPVPVKKFPVLLNFFPVNFRRELLKKRLQHSGFSIRNLRLEPQKCKI